MSRAVKVFHAGRLGYKKGLEIQTYLSDKVRTKKLPDTLVVIEHNPVYTVGIRQKLYLEEEEKKLVELGAEFYRTNRGGLITFHGPGQLVIYPIINLKNFRPSIRWYVESLQDVVISLCREFSLIGHTSPHTGVWVNDMKICAIGIHASRYVTTHGIALNCNIDLNWFSHIIPCGIIDKKVTSLTHELQKDVGPEEAFPKFKDSFSNVFDCSVSDFTNEETEKILNDVWTSN